MLGHYKLQSCFLSWLHVNSIACGCGYSLFVIKGGEQVTKVGGGGGGGGGGAQTMTTVRLWAYAHGPPRRVWRHAPPENFGNFDSLRAFLIHSGSSFWTDLVAIFTQALFCKRLE